MVRWLGRGMAGMWRARGAEVDVVTWAPTTPARRRRRGFDQAELLARVVASELRRPCLCLVSRRPGPPQTGRSEAERAGNPVFDAVRGAEGRRVLLIDDVVTTGATVAAAGRVLADSGAVRVHALAAAHPP